MITQIKQKDELTERVIGCCFKVHRELGPGFPEKVYQAALLESLRSTGVLVVRERRFQVQFEGVLVGQFQVDFVVEERVILELKAVTGPLPNVFQAQLMAYLKAAALTVGLLVNFGNISCQVKRIMAPSALSVLSVKSLSVKSAFKSV